MTGKIKILSGPIEVSAVLYDTVTASKIWDSLPFEETVNVWGDEIYFTVPVKTGIEDGAQETVQAGDMGFWPTGSAFCIFFGPTPISREGEIRPASAVNVFGKVEGEPSVLKGISAGVRVRIEKAKG